MRLAIVIPSYNTDPWKPELCTRMNQAISLLLEQEGIQTEIIWVDDGSNRAGGLLIEQERALEAVACPKTFLRHILNRGQGAALQTGIRAASVAGFDFIATFDSDGQHDPFDLPIMIKKLRAGNFDIIFGNRFLSPQFKESGIPQARRAILFLARCFDRAFTGLALGDAHNGYRVFNERAAQMITILQDRMAHATEIKFEVKHLGLRYSEVPVSIQYTADRLQAGQGNLNAFNIIRELLEGWWFT